VPGDTGAIAPRIQIAPNFIFRPELRWEAYITAALQAPGMPQDKFLATPVIIGGES